MSKKTQAIEINERGNSCRQSGNWQAAIELYEQAAALEPKWSSPLYNLGLVYKYQSRWEESREYNLRVTNMNPKDEAAWWNLGIAATALGDWKTARAAWTGFGLDVPKGRWPIDFPCGFGPIRLNPEGNAEVVWAHRLCPARARLMNIPFPESNHRWQDVILNDGAPVGYRTYNGQEIPVFNELALLEPSAYGTYLVESESDITPEMMVQLNEIAFRQYEGYADNWTQSVRMICRECSEGTPHEKHEYEVSPSEGVQRIAIATKSLGAAKDLLKAWKKQVKSVQFGKLQELLPAAG